MNKTDRIKRREYFKEQRRASKLPTWQDLPKDTIGELHSEVGDINIEDLKANVGIEEVGKMPVFDIKALEKRTLELLKEQRVKHAIPEESFLQATRLPLMDKGVLEAFYKSVEEEIVEMTEQTFVPTYKTLLPEEFQKVISNMTYGENKL